MKVPILELMRNRQAKMIKKINLAVFILLVVLLVSSLTNPADRTHIQQQAGLGIMFYNVENLFDTVDSRLDDDEFLPSAGRRWNTYKYYRKLHNIFKVIALCSNEMQIPDIIGLCEVENDNALNDLCEKTFLNRENYGYLISDGLDVRGISTALLYRKDKLTVINSGSWKPRDSKGRYISTRAVLYSSLEYKNDTVLALVCHWPSRRGGAIASEVRRKEVASFIKTRIDSIGASRKIIIMGDLNDEPESVSVIEVLGASPESSGSNSPLINVSDNKGNLSASYKYRGTWYMFDQFILSSSLYDAQEGLYYKKHSFRVINDDALMGPDNSYKGFRPNGTWNGYNYTGAYSDHLPVSLSLGMKN